jgi:hypothetical protein
MRKRTVLPMIPATSDELPARRPVALPLCDAGHSKVQFRAGAVAGTK